jgi:hypothetical protein
MMRGTWDDALRHAFAPSWTVLVVAAVWLGAFVGLLLYLSPPRLHAALSVYPGLDRLNDNYYLFDKVTREFAGERAGRAFRIAIVGASTTREALWSENSLAQSLAQKTSRPIEVIELTSGGQDLVTSWALTERALCNGADMVVLGLSVGRMSRGDAGRNPVLTYGYPSRAVQAAVERGETAPAAAARQRDSFSFTLASLQFGSLYLLHDLTGFTNEAIADGGQPRHRFFRYVHYPDAVTARINEAARRHVPDFQSSFAKGREAIRALIETTAYCGGHIVVLDTPMNPILRDKMARPYYAQAYETHRQFLADISARYNIPLLIPNDAVAYRPEDFHDYGHLRTERAMSAVTEFMAEELARIIPSAR